MILATNISRSREMVDPLSWHHALKDILRRDLAPIQVPIIRKCFDKTCKLKCMRDRSICIIRSKFGHIAIIYNLEAPCAVISSNIITLRRVWEVNRTRAILVNWSNKQYAMRVESLFADPQLHILLFEGSKSGYAVWILLDEVISKYSQSCIDLWGLHILFSFGVGDGWASCFSSIFRFCWET